MTEAGRRCPGIYEDIMAGTRSGCVLFESKEHGVALIRDISPVGAAHVLAVPLLCRPSMDTLPRTLRNKVYHVATFAGRVITSELGAQYAGQLVAGDQVPHAHVHRAMGDPDADWAKRFGKALPRLDPSEASHFAQLPEVFGACDDLRAQCLEDIEAEGPPDVLTLEAMALLAADLGGRARP